MFGRVGEWVGVEVRRWNLEIWDECSKFEPPRLSKKKERTQLPKTKVRKPKKSKQTDKKKKHGKKTERIDMRRGGWEEGALLEVRV